MSSIAANAASVASGGGVSTSDTVRSRLRLEGGKATRRHPDVLGALAVALGRGVDVGGIGPQRSDRALLARAVLKGVERVEATRVLPGDRVNLGVGALRCLQ